MENFLMWAGGLIITACFGLIGWLVNMIFARLDKHEQKHEEFEQGDVAIVKALDAHRLYAAETFATKLDVRDMADRVLSKLDKMDEKLDRKVDK